jgi:glutamate-1-semialdehyde aminotransferase
MKNLHRVAWAGLSLLFLGCHSAPPPAHGHAGHAGHAMMCQHDCPMHQAATLSDVKVQTTAGGAVIELVAKRPEDAAKVQQSAQRMAEMLNAGGCANHNDGGAHHHHHSQP